MGRGRVQTYPVPIGADVTRRSVHIIPALQPCTSAQYCTYNLEYDFPAQLHRHTQSIAAVEERCSKNRTQRRIDVRTIGRHRSPGAVPAVRQIRPFQMRRWGGCCFHVAKPNMVWFGFVVFEANAVAVLFCACGFAGFERNVDKRRPSA